jgi:thymidylate synthase
MNYKEIVRRILDYGDPKPSRTGMDTISLTGTTFEHDMAEGFPLTGLRRVSFRIAAVETEFHLQGLHDKRWLQERNVHIWDDWCDPRVVPYGHGADARDAMRDEPELGRIYGVQWRRWRHFKQMPISRYLQEAELDQVERLERTLRRNPDDRRMLVTAWNPAELHQMALPPCFLLWQVTANEHTLDLCWYQRSCDTMLGLPMDIAIHGIILEALCLIHDKKPGRLVGFLADTHIYMNHVKQAWELAERKEPDLPRLTWEEDAESWKALEDYRHEAAGLVGYKPHWPMKMEVSV